MPARPLDFRIDADVAARALIQRLDKFQLLFQRASRFRTHLYRLEIDEPAQGEANLPVVKLSASVIEQLRTKVGDPVYVTETRWWLVACIPYTSLSEARVIIAMTWSKSVQKHSS